MSYFVSIVIPTYNRGVYLRNTVHALLKQDYPFLEIIIVDQSDDLALGIKADAFDKECKVKYFRSNEIGPPAAKNYGISKAQGEIILTLDDDIIPEQNLIVSHIQHYSNPDIVSVAGRVFRPGEEEIHTMKVGRVKPNGLILGNFTSSMKTTVESAMGCNLSYRKDIFKKIGGYNTHYVGNFVREESDLCFKIRRLGYKIIYEPEARILHVKAPRGGCRIENDLIWQFFFLHNNTLFFLNHMKRYYLPFFLYEHLKRAMKHFYHHGKKYKDLRFLVRGIHLGYLTYKRGFFDQDRYGKYRNEDS